MYNIFGHVHEAAGGFSFNKELSSMIVLFSIVAGLSSDGKCIFINASTCNIEYLPNNPPIVFDCPIKTKKP